MEPLERNVVRDSMKKITARFKYNLFISFQTVTPKCMNVMHVCNRRYNEQINIENHVLSITCRSDTSATKHYKPAHLPTTQ